MAFNRRFPRNNVREKNISCSCDGNAKLSSRKNYPFGRKSKGVTSNFYKCKSCNKITFVNKEVGGRR